MDDCIKTVRYLYTRIIFRFKINDLEFIWILGWLDTIYFKLQTNKVKFHHSFNYWILGLLDKITHCVLVNDKMLNTWIHESNYPCIQSSKYLMEFKIIFTDKRELYLIIQLPKWIVSHSSRFSCIQISNYLTILRL